MELGDNDAGLRLSCANSTKRTKMLDGLRHDNVATYARLIALDQDSAAGDPLWPCTRTTFGLSDEESRQPAADVHSTASIPRSACQSGRMRFDLEPESFLRDGNVADRTIDCANP
jgi:hypothetical protein